MPNQETIKQHFVPQFYLARFANPNGFVEILDLKNRRIAKSRPYGSVCYEKYFYALETGTADNISQEYEKMFSGLEDLTAKEWDEIIRNAARKKLTYENCELLSWFLSMQWMRTPAFRRQMNSMESDILQQIMQLRAETKEFDQSYRKVATKYGRLISDEDMRILKEDIVQKKFKIKTNNAGHLKFIPGSLEGFHNLFFNKQWNIFLAPGNCQFITTDNPVAEWQPKRTTCYGTDFLSRKHYFALTPKILIEFIYPTRDSLKVGPHETATYCYIPKDKAQMYNVVLANHGHEYGYAQGKKEFEEMIRQINKPGRAIDLYIENYLSKQ